MRLYWRVMACAALAAPLGVAMPGAGTARDWGGPYLSFGAGYGTAATGNAGAFFTIVFEEIGGEGASAEIGFGYDWIVGPRTLAGLQLGYHAGGPAASFGGNEAGHDGGYALTGRLGHAAAPETVLYGLAGVARDTFFSEGGSATVEQDYDGFVLGFGAETALGARWRLRGEYRLADFESAPFASGDEIAPRTHTILASAVYSFGQGRRFEAPRPDFRFEGASLSAQIGMSAANQRTTFLTADFDGLGGDGPYAGFGAGYDWVLGGAALVGLRGEVRLSGPVTRATSGSDTTELTLDTGYDAYVRLGRLLGPSTALYVLAGYTHQNFDLDQSGGISDDADAGGLLLGFGIETALNERLSAITEFRHSEYDRPGAPGTAFDFDPATTSAHMGLGFRF